MTRLDPLAAVGSGDVEDVEPGMWIQSKSRQDASGQVAGVVVDVTQDASGGLVFAIWRQDRKLWFDTLLADDVNVEPLEDFVAFDKRMAGVAAQQILSALPRRLRRGDGDFVAVAGRLQLLADNPGQFLPKAARRYQAAVDANRTRGHGDDEGAVA